MQIQTLDTGSAQLSLRIYDATDQGAQLWSEAGVLLATSTQLVYYKE